MCLVNLIVALAAVAGTTNALQDTASGDTSFIAPRAPATKHSLILLHFLRQWVIASRTG
jgi:hypothetical protein